MTSTRSSGPSTSPRARSMRSRFSRSLYVGRQTTARTRFGCAVIGLFRSRTQKEGIEGGTTGSPLSRRRRAASPYHRFVATTLPPNTDVAEQLDLLADLLELEGQDAFRVLAYRRAAARIRETGGSIAQLALEGRAKALQGIGKTIEEKIVQIAERGEIEALTRRKERIPAGVVAFMHLPGLGPKTARRIWQELGLTTLEELKQAAEEQRLRTLAGLGAKSEENVLKALAARPADSPAGPTRTLLGTALPAVLAAVDALREHPAAVKVSEAGSARRRRETVRDVDIIATAKDASALIDHFVGLPWVVEVVAKGGTKATVASGAGLRFDLRVVPPECYANLAVTDHSHYLLEGRLAAQAEEIDRLNERLAPFQLLKGIEVNIRADGSLDVSEELLAGRDWVVASLHSAFQREPTERILAAMESPHVSCIGHPTARKIGKRPGADLDLDRVVEKALEPP